MFHLLFVLLCVHDNLDLFNNVPHTFLIPAVTFLGFMFVFIVIGFFSTVLEIYELRYGSVKSEMNNTCIFLNQKRKCLNVFIVAFDTNYVRFLSLLSFVPVFKHAITVSSLHLTLGCFPLVLTL